jgi:formylglycine-generating enzyme
MTCVKEGNGVRHGVKHLDRAWQLTVASCCMADVGGREAQPLVRHVAWWAMWMAASCGYPDLSRLSGADAPGDMPGSDMSGSDAPPQSSRCPSLAATCGASANADCCQVRTVQGGTFFRSYDGTLYPDMGFPATVSTFVLDTYEVTVGRFRSFVDAGMGTQTSPPVAGAGAHPRLAGSGWDSSWNVNLATNTAGLTSMVKCSAASQTWTDTPGANENKPINCVTWYEAMAFCIWDGGYLASEAEWNYAASGGIEQRVYPWSDPANSLSIDCRYANYNINSPPGASCVNGTNRVGSELPMGDGRWGHSDLAGNVYEWTFDWHASSYPLPCDDCANLTASSLRVFRGGGFLSLQPAMSAARRSGNSPSSRGPDLGVRCARMP